MGRERKLIRKQKDHQAVQVTKAWFESTDVWVNRGTKMWLSIPLWRSPWCGVGIEKLACRTNFKPGIVEPGPRKGTESREINGNDFICSLSHLYKKRILALVSLMEVYLCSVSVHLHIGTGWVKSQLGLQKQSHCSLPVPHCLSGSLTLPTESEGRG